MPRQTTKKPKPKIKKEWTLPNPGLSRKGEATQLADIRRRITKYISKYPEQFPEDHPLSTGHRLYATLATQYMRKATTKQPWDTAARLNRIPMIDLSGGQAYESNKDAVDFYMKLRPEYKMQPPIAGLQEFTILVKRDRDNKPEDLIYVEYLPPTKNMEGRNHAKRIHVMGFTQDRNVWQPTMSIAAELFPADPDTTLTPSDFDTEGDPDLYKKQDTFQLTRDDTRMLLSYFTSVPPNELKWAPDEYRFWEEVVLYNGAHSDWDSLEEKLDARLIQILARALINTIYDVATNGFLIEEDLSSETNVMRARRPKHLKINEHDDVRRVWKLGGLSYEALEPPEIDPDFRDHAQELLAGQETGQKTA